MRRLLITFVLGLAVFAGVKIYRALQATRPPRVPDDWRRLAQTDATLAAALALRDRLSRAARKAAPEVRLRLLRGVHEALAELVTLVGVRLELLDYLRTPEVADRAMLQDRAEALGAGAETARRDLERVYAELLASVADQTAGGEAAVGAVRTVLDDLRLQRQAETEVRRLLADRTLD